MNCRKITNEGKIVWFNSLGKSENGLKIPDNNYDSEKNAIADSLKQKLSVIEGELWYNIQFGLPIMNKITAKAFLDSFIAKIIHSNSDVLSILNFESKLENHHYYCSMQIKTKYGDLLLKI